MLRQSHNLCVLLIVIFSVFPLSAGYAAEKDFHSSFNVHESAQQPVRYTVQVHAFENREAAQAFAAVLIEKGYDGYVISVDDGSPDSYKVRFGGFQTTEQARSAADRYMLHESAPGSVVPAAPEVIKKSMALGSTVRSDNEGRAQFVKRLAGTLMNAVPERPIEALLGRTVVEIEPEFSYRLEYEDNIDNDRKNKLSDFSNHYRPALTLNVTASRFFIGSSVKLNIADYTSEKDFNYVDQQYDVSVAFSPHDRVESVFFGSYTVRNDISRLLETGDAFTPIDEFEFRRSKDKTKAFGGIITFLLSPRSTLMLNGLFAQYDSFTTDESNFYQAAANYIYKLTSQTKLTMRASFFYYDFDFKIKRDVLLAEELVDFFSFLDYTMKNINASVGIEHVFDRGLTLKADAGFRRTRSEFRQTGLDEDGLRFKEKTSGTGTGWVGSIEAKQQVSDFSFLFQARHDISVDSRGSSYERTNLYLRTSYAVTRRVDATVMLRFMRSYADPKDKEFRFGIDRNTYYISSTLRYQCLRWLNITLAHSYRYSDNKNSGTSLHANIFYVAVNVSPVRPRVFR